MNRRSPKSRILKTICFLTIQMLTVCHADNEKTCCENILLDADKEVHNMTFGYAFGFYKQFGYHDGKPTYRQEGGKYFLIYSKDKQKWIGYSVFGSQTDMKNANDGYCLEDKNDWSFLNGGKFISSESLKTKCSNIEDVCCQDVNITYSKSEFNYTKSVMESLGVYKAVGMINGRYIYQKDNTFRFLWYDVRSFVWTVNGFDGGFHIYSQGLHVCPENDANEWTIRNEKDINLDITCIKQERGMNQSRYRTTAFVFGFFTFFLMLVVIIFYGKRFFRYWLRGAHGKHLIWQTLDLE